MNYLGGRPRRSGSAQRAVPGHVVGGAFLFGNTIVNRNPAARRVEAISRESMFRVPMPARAPAEVSSWNVNGGMLAPSRNPDGSVRKESAVGADDSNVVFVSM